VRSSTNIALRRNRTTSYMS